MELGGGGSERWDELGRLLDLVSREREGDEVGEHGLRTGWSPVGKVFPAPEAQEPFLEK